MSKLERLIEELCPDGVEFVSIRDCVKKIKNIKWTINEEGEYQYIDLTSVDRETHQITGTQIIRSENAPSRAKQIVLAGDVLFGSTRPMLKRYCLIEDDYDGQICSTGFCVLRANENVALQKWIYHQISSVKFFTHVENHQKGASYPAISDTDVKSYKIPLPPLPIQEEIVRILDKFIQLIAELTAELIARKKQYEYYRDSLLSFGEEVGWKKLSLIANIGTGNSNTNEQLEAGEYPFFVRSQKVRRKNSYEFDETAIITSGDGVGVGKIYHYIEGKYALHQRAYRINITDDNVIPKYYYYYMKATFLHYIQKNAMNSSVTSIRRKMLDNYSVPIPSIEEQQRIVEILDRFDKLCNDLSSGLPAEIEARRKQYEYYRDKLLTFKEVVS